MNIQDMERAIEFLTQNAAKHDAQLDKLIIVTNTDADNIRALARVAEIHETRIARLEGDPE